MVIGIVVGAVALVAVAVAAWWFGFRPPTAQDAAGTYLRALETGDLAAIQAMRAPLDEETDRIIEESFAGATSYLVDARIEEMRERKADLVSVHATAEVDGTRRDLLFDLRRSGDRWSLAGDYLASATVEVVLAGSDVAVGDVRIGGALVGAGTATPLLPAVYPVTAGPRELLSGTSTLAVSNDRAEQLALEVTLSPDAAASAQEQLNAYASACAEAAETVPENCGLVIPWAADLARLERIAFRVERLPSVTLLPENGSFAATEGVIVATAHGTGHDGRDGFFTYRTDQWALRGAFGFDDGIMVLTVR